ncbi:nuclease-related domain-containing protein [Frigoribacterium sp. SL97]|uniref:nuclease-related domain-containing protein n=1 Tax=Frigoribacterium sp. SL97 TaxID=2994664 RepID=UPI00226D8E56|nr:nuclease-related domain-containing protein [Frigoribacterium sp. SL97]WAC50530.1 nuclease-related domain-containing protein [Frigoribacterium sp. SL97]
MSTRIPGQVIGTAGGSLAGAGSTFAANASVARVGAEGERKSAAILNKLAARPGGPSVLHDLSIPLPGVRANVDHVVVSGRTVTVIDTKAWAGAIYWTLAGKTFRGLKRFVVEGKGGTSYPAEKRTLLMARTAYAKHLGIPEADIRLGLIIWPTGRKRHNTLLLAAAGNPKTVDGNALTVGRAGRLFGSRPADPTILTALARLTK